MAITSLTFILFAGVVVLAFHANDSARYRLWLCAAANAAFIASQVDGVQALLPLLGFVALGYAALRWVRRGPGWVLAGCLALVVAGFVVLKRYAFLDGWLAPSFPYLSVGLSYLLFRLIHLLADARAGELPAAIGPLNYFNYTCNFLCFISGPIQRYQDYAASTAAAPEAEKRPDLPSHRPAMGQPAAEERAGEVALPPVIPEPLLDQEQVFRAFSRVVTGFLKVAVVSAALNQVFSQMAATLPDAGPLAFSGAAVIYTLYLYFNFSGYMDIVIGIGVLLGQRLPENFNQPFAALNFLEFWTRWHITLSDWFRTYLFNPLLKLLVGHFRLPAAAPWLGVVAFFATFLVMGLWHGTTPMFAAYGLLLGGGAAANKLWQLALNRRLGKAGYRALAERGSYRALCRGATFAYFALALSCLWLQPDRVGELWHALGSGGLLANFLASFLLVTLGSALALPAWDYAAATLRSATAGLARPSAGAWVWRNAALAGQVLLVLFAVSWFHMPPEFVYRDF